MGPLGAKALLVTKSGKNVTVRGASDGPRCGPYQRLVVGLWWSEETTAWSSIALQPTTVPGARASHEQLALEDPNAADIRHARREKARVRDHELSSERVFLCLSGGCLANVGAA